MNRPNQGASSPSSIVISALFLGVVVLVAAWGMSRAVSYLAEGGVPPWASVFVNYSTMLAVTLILVLASSMGDPSGFGFVLPRRGSYGTCVTWGLVLGVVGTVVMLLAGAGGVRVMRGLGFWQMILLVWLFASVAEEVLVRGYFQSYLEPLRGHGFTAFRMRFSVPVILSALFFSCMHLILLTTETSPAAVYLVMVFTFFLGLVAAYHRERSDSLLPPITAHISFNIGGVIGAILFVIAQIVIFGKSAAEVARIITG
ncbi:MAG: CPBP family intramembrane metalloprotease [Candidatus Eisenbacteria bacterium]|nr:CPBP family intramembrane metalloprotease [Candidatus Eisenbacteria bacterium]